VASREVIPLHAANQGIVTTVYASLGEHVDKGGPLIGLDPNLSPERLFEQERRLAAEQQGTAQLERTHEMLKKLLEAPEPSRLLALKDLGVNEDTFSLVNDLYTARLELDGANQAQRSSAGHQKSQLASEIGLAQRNIDLLKRNLAASKQNLAARDAALQAKRQDFSGLGKLAEKGLVSSTDVTHERDSLLQAEMGLDEAHKQADQLELEISNRNLHISELKNQAESSDEEAGRRIRSAQVRYDLRLARLKELQTSLARQLQGLRRASAQPASHLDVSSTSAEAHVVHSPVAGIVVRVGYSRIGDRVERGDLLALIAPDGSQARANLQVSPLDVLRLRPGQAASVEIDAYPARRFGSIPGTVEQVFALPDGNSFAAIIGLNKTTLRVYGVEAALLPNLTVHAEISVAPRRLWDVVVGR
jgi:multidrug resistance efflux pump